MTALGLIAPLRAGRIWHKIDRIIQAADQGSVITQDWSVRVLAAVSAQDAAYEQRIFPFLLDFLRRCPAKDLPRHAESVRFFGAANAGNRDALLEVLESRKGSLKAAQGKRLDSMIRRLKAL